MEKAEIAKINIEEIRIKTDIIFKPITFILLPFHSLFMYEIIVEDNMIKPINIGQIYSSIYFCSPELFAKL